MTLGPQFSLRIAGSDNGGSPAHPAEGDGGLEAQFPGMLGDQVGDLMSLEVPPHVFGGVELWSVGRQALDFDAATSAGQVFAHQDRAVDARAVPEDQDFAADAALEVTEELHHLRALDASGVDLKVEAQDRQSTDDREALPVEGLLENGRLAPGSPGTRAGGPCAQAALVDKDDQPALAPRFFLSPATALVSSARWSARRVPRPAVRALTAESR